MKKIISMLTMSDNLLTIFSISTLLMWGSTWVLMEAAKSHFIAVLGLPMVCLWIWKGYSVCRIFYDKYMIEDE